MRCTRCEGLMVREKFEDLGTLGPNDYEYAGWRCINCGEIVDPVIAAHRRLTSRPAASHSALTTVQGQFVRGCFMDGELVAPRLLGVSR